MRLLLIRPDSASFCVTPPLGLLSIAAYLRRYSSHEIGIYDALEKCADDEMIRRAVKEFDPEMVGITALSHERIEAHHTARIIKEQYPHLKLIMGGAYASSDPFEVMRNPAVDYVVAGEGEAVTLSLLNALEAGRDASDIRGVVSRNGEEPRYPGPAELIEDIDSIPMPAWDLIDLESYFNNPRRPSAMNLHARSKRCAPVFPSRGCPYSCIYCHNIFGKKFRLRSLDNVIGEIRYLKEEKGVEEIEIVDDIFNLDNQRALEFARRIIEGGFNLGFSFPQGIRADQMSKELVDRMVEMGMFRVNYAIETFDREMQRTIRKNLNLEKAVETIEYTFSKGVSVGVYYMIGLPGETEAQAQATLDRALKVKCSTASFYILNPFPGTEVYRKSVEEGIIKEDKVNYHYYSLGNNVSLIPDKKLKRMFNRAYRRFYLHPVRLWRFLSATPLHYYFFRKLKAIAYLFFYKSPTEKKAELDRYIDGSEKRPIFK